MHLNALCMINCNPVNTQLSIIIQNLAFLHSHHCAGWWPRMIPRHDISAHSLLTDMDTAGHHNRSWSCWVYEAIQSHNWLCTIFPAGSCFTWIPSVICNPSLSHCIINKDRKKEDKMCHSTIHLANNKMSVCGFGKPNTIEDNEFLWKVIKSKHPNCTSKSYAFIVQGPTKAICG